MMILDQLPRILADHFSNPGLWISLIVLSIATVMFFQFISSKTDPKLKDTNGTEFETIPWTDAAARVPLLGHALAYRRDPPGFLRKTLSKHPVAKIDLAGTHMVIMEGNLKIALASERNVASARHAIANLGFEETLGAFNVHSGTDIHKRIIKEILNHDANDLFQQWTSSLRRAVKDQVRASGNQKVEIFVLFRQIMLQFVLDNMIGIDFLQENDDFLDRYIRFQDNLEDATAKAVALPKWIATPLILRPVRTQRKLIEKDIASRLKDIIAQAEEKNEDSNPRHIGMWLRLVYKDHSIADIAELVVGLLFAVHKNVAIGATQAFLLLHKSCSPEEIKACTDESKKLLSTTRIDSMGAMETSFPHLRSLCLETLRIMAHTIGGARIMISDLEIEIKGQLYLLRKGDYVGLTHLVPNLDANNWGHDSDSIRLFRKPFDDYNDEYKFTTFSHGVHKCPGQTLAVYLMQAIVSIMTHDYRVSIPDTIPDLSFEKATLAQRKAPIYVTVRKH